MTEIGNRIYPLGRDQRVSVHVCGEEGGGGAEHADLLLVGREVWQLGLLMRGRALLEPAEHRPLGFQVLPVFTCPAVSPATGSYQARSEWDTGIPPATFQNFTPTESFSADLAKLPLMVRARPGSLRALFLWHFLQAACSCLYLCYHRLQLHCLKLTDSQWYLCLCASVYLDSFVFDEARTHAHT